MITSRFPTAHVACFFTLFATADGLACMPLAATNAVPTAPPAALSGRPSRADAGTADLRFRPAAGDTLRYRLAWTNRRFGPDNTTLISSCTGEAVLAITVTNVDARGKAVEARYERITLTSKVGDEQLSYDSAAERFTPPQQPLDRLVRKVLAKTLAVTLDADGRLPRDAQGRPRVGPDQRLIDVRGFPGTVFEGMAEYLDPQDTRAAGVIPAATMVSGLGTAGNLPWLAPMFEPGCRAPKAAEVGAAWPLCCGDPQRVELVEVAEDRAVIRGQPAAADDPRGEAKPGGPAQVRPETTPERFVWDTRHGSLVQWEQVFDTLGRQGFTERVVQQWMIERLDGDGGAAEQEGK